MTYCTDEAEADQRWLDAGRNITACDYPERLRCEEENVAAEAPSLSPGLRNLTLPFFNKKAIDDVMCRVGAPAASASPIDECFATWYLSVSDEEIDAMEAQLRGTCGRVDREMATRACQMRMASQRPGQEEGKALFTAMEKELQQLHFDLLLAQGAANGQDFTKRFYAPAIDATAHWDDAPHVEKCLIHGIQRSKTAIAEQIEAMAVDSVDEPTEASGEGCGNATDFVFKRPPGDMQAVCADRLMKVALAYREFSGIVKVKRSR